VFDDMSVKCNGDVVVVTMVKEERTLDGLISTRHSENFRSAAVNSTTTMDHNFEH